MEVELHNEKNNNSTKLPLTDEDKLLQMFQKSLLKLKKERKDMNFQTTNIKESNVSNNNSSKDFHEFKSIIEISLGFRKLLKNYIHQLITQNF